MPLTSLPNLLTLSRILAIPVVIHLLKRQPDGTWKIAQDVWNSDAPAVAPMLPPAKNKK